LGVRKKNGTLPASYLGHSIKHRDPFARNESGLINFLNNVGNQHFNCLAVGNNVTARSVADIQLRFRYIARQADPPQ
jgi:hypothetical protein